MMKAMTKYGEILNLSLLRNVELRDIKAGRRSEVYRSIYFGGERFLDVDREGYGYFCPACNGDLEDMKRDCKDSLSEFTRLLKQNIEEGVFQIHHYDTICTPVRLPKSDYRNYRYEHYKCEGISIGYGRPEWGGLDNQEVFIIKIGKRI